MAKLSVELERYFFEEERASDVKLTDILSLAGERIFGFLFIILALPSALPVPAPGYSVPFGILMFILAIQLIAGYKALWFPEKIMKGSIKLETVQKFLEKGIPWLKKIEALTHPRMTYVCTSLPGRVVIGVAIALMSIFMIIPIPGTNTLPAMGIFVTAFGLQENDGFISLVGLIICLIAGTMSTLIIFLGKEVIELIFNLIK
ncbi:exopolysaccharide biosynthesis protein [cyanobacterium endosymbiont of Epithemia turgida]|uniref:exopolysaccharide biosynthesis protein n=1 Tax=cyanobacterium endosymbiont of Epithemia turgida TaxID=718217 RepID=UPI0004D13DAE|nr:exopolysaccharide biosynthesis protein [cyanobacterium endosymbiont of Epithemia turgida]BAP17086.1 exopolysaccharide synthesis protein [cyanobacterium endosymbiont of Epithemia turgida isolate EtSB Lake Yunoko]